MKLKLQKDSIIFYLDNEVTWQPKILYMLYGNLAAVDHIRNRKIQKTETEKFKHNV